MMLLLILRSQIATFRREAFRETDGSFRDQRNLLPQRFNAFTPPLFQEELNRGNLYALCLRCRYVAGQRR